MKFSLKNSNFCINNIKKEIYMYTHIRNFTHLQRSENILHDIIYTGIAVNTSYSFNINCLCFVMRKKKKQGQSVVYTSVTIHDNIFRSLHLARIYLIHFRFNNATKTRRKIEEQLRTECILHARAV